MKRKNRRSGVKSQRSQMDGQAQVAMAGWDGVERRKGAPPPPLFAELLLECQWRPSDRLVGFEGGWFRAHGHAEDRRRVGAAASAPN